MTGTTTTQSLLLVLLVGVALLAAPAHADANVTLDFRAKEDSAPDSLDMSMSEAADVTNVTSSSTKNATSDTMHSDDVPGPEITCVDEIWNDATTTCEEHKGWGQCFDDFMVKRGENEENDLVGVISFCAKTCERCPGDLWDPALYFEKTGRSLYLGQDMAVQSARNAPDAVFTGIPDDQQYNPEAPKEEEADAIAAEEEEKEEEKNGGFAAGIKSAKECEGAFAAFGSLRGLQNDGDIMTCVSGAGGRCCSGVRRYLGRGTSLYGCACHPGLLTRALQDVPSFVRPIITTAIRSCNIPMGMNDRKCKA